MPVVRQGFASPGQASRARIQPGPSVRQPSSRVPATFGLTALSMANPYAHSPTRTAKPRTTVPRISLRGQCERPPARMSTFVRLIATPFRCTGWKAAQDWSGKACPQPARVNYAPSRTLSNRLHTLKHSHCHRGMVTAAPLVGGLVVADVTNELAIAPWTLSHHVDKLTNDGLATIEHSQIKPSQRMGYTFRA